MLLILNVQFYRNAPVAPLSQNFTENGGTIGRSPGNLLVLDDPSKFISRTHALVSFRGGQFFLADMGSNPSVVNDRPLGKAREIALVSGDRIAVGDYLMQVQINNGATVSVDANADQFGLPLPAKAPPAASSPIPLFEPPPALAQSVLPPLSSQGRSTAASAILPPMATRDALAGADILAGPLSGGNGTQFDPLGLNLFCDSPGGNVGNPESIVGDPLGVGFRGSANDHAAPEHFAMPMTPAPLPYVPTAVPAAGRWSVGGIPEDYDPMGEFLPPAVVPVKSIVHATQTQTALPISGVATAPALQLPTDFDPLADMTGSNFVAPAAPIVADKSYSVGATDDLHAHPSMTFQDAIPNATKSPTGPEFASAVVAAPASAAGIAVSTNTGNAAVRSTGKQVELTDAGVFASDSTHAALLRGLGLPDLKTKLSAPELAELVGAMLREATGGAMQTLMARSLTKRESRVEMTMIASQANNPLKFFPDPGSALTQMLAQNAGGYMKPVRAFSNAFEDLQAHELAVMAGMRAALSAVLKRFDPQAIEQRLDVPTVLDKMMTSGRKAKMWDRLVALYVEISREADDDFQRLFGESFAQAYEEQVDRMARRGK